MFALPDDMAASEGRSSGTPWTVTSVKASADFSIYVTFIDGVEGRIDMFDFVHSSGAGVFMALRDIDIFKQVFVDYGAVTWPGELDLAPDAMHDDLQLHGDYALSVREDSD